MSDYTPLHEYLHDVHGSPEDLTVEEKVNIAFSYITDLENRIEELEERVDRAERDIDIVDTGAV